MAIRFGVRSVRAWTTTTRCGGLARLRAPRRSSLRWPSSLSPRRPGFFGGNWSPLRCKSQESETERVELDEDQILLNRLDIRVGKILSVKEHEEADSLFIESIDVGDEEGPRTIVSGLKPYMPASDLEGKLCVVLANLKPRNMRGVKSHGMLLCASDKEVEGEERVELLSPRIGTPVGERLRFGSFVPSEELPAPDGPNKIQKKKIWEKVQADLKTDGEGAAKWKGLALLSSAGEVTCASLKNSSIS